MGGYVPVAIFQNGQVAQAACKTGEACVYAASEQAGKNPGILLVFLGIMASALLITVALTWTRFKDEKFIKA